MQISTSRWAQDRALTEGRGRSCAMLTGTLVPLLPTTGPDFNCARLWPSAAPSRRAAENSFNNALMSSAARLVGAGSLH